MKNRSSFTFALLLAVAIPAAGQAQGIGFGVHTGYSTDVKELLLGGSVELSLPGPLSFATGFDLYPGFVGGSLFSVDFDVNFAIPATGLDPYVGVGLFLHHSSFDLGTFGTISGNNVGFSLNGGLGFGSGPIRPFAETKLRVAETTGITLKGGLKFMLGH